MDLRESPITLTEYELQNFISSQIWNTMCREMQIWLIDIHEQLEVTTETDILRKLQGNAEAVRRFLELPERLLELVRMRHES
jgi:hypothetical protein